MVLYFDTETTGLRPGNICQLSYVMQDTFGLRAKNFFFTVDAVEYSAYLVHGFSVSKLFELSGGRRFKDFAQEIAYDFDSADLIVAHNINFDLNFLRSEFASCGIDFKYRKEFCSMKSAVPVCKLPRARGMGYKYPKLTELCSFFNVDECEIQAFEKLLYGESSASHDARYDTSAMFLCLKKGGEDFPECLSIEEYV